MSVDGNRQPAMCLVLCCTKHVVRWPNRSSFQSLHTVLPETLRQLESMDLGAVPYRLDRFARFHLVFLGGMLVLHHSAIGTIVSRCHQRESCVQPLLLTVSHIQPAALELVNLVSIVEGLGLRIQWSRPCTWRSAQQVHQDLATCRGRLHGIS